MRRSGTRAPGVPPFLPRASPLHHYHTVALFRHTRTAFALWRQQRLPLAGASSQNINHTFIAAPLVRAPAPPTAALTAARRAQQQQQQQQQQQHPDSDGASDDYSVSAHVAEAEGLLREVFGPQAKLTINELAQPHARRRRNQQQQEPEDEMGGEDEALDERGSGSGAALSSSTYFRVSATFRLLAFPVELAATKGRRPAETIENCLRQALASDVEFVHPRAGSRHGNGQRHGRQHQHQQQQRIPPLTPSQQEMKAVLDELRQLCMHFSRSVKFSLKPPPASIGRGPHQPQQQQQEQQEQGLQQEEEEIRRDASKWRCRVYVRDEWAVVAYTEFALEQRGHSPKDALARAAAALRDAYRDEMASPEVLRAGVAELAALVAPAAMTVTATVAADDAGGGRQPRGPGALDADEGIATAPAAAASAGGAQMLRCEVVMEDAHGNRRRCVARRQPSALAAYAAGSAMAVRAERRAAVHGATRMGEATAVASGSSGGAAPLLQRLRWQYEAMRAAAAAEGVRDVAAVVLGGMGRVEGTARSGAEAAVTTDNTDSSSRGGGGSGGDGSSSGVPLLFTAALRGEDGDVLWQATGGGRYRLEVDAYTQALRHLLETYPGIGRRVASGSSGQLFASAAELEAAVAHHDRFPLVAMHRGAWSGYALLGTATSQLLGSYYTTHYHQDPLTQDWHATLTVDDGYHTAQVLIQRAARQRGEAWRRACLDALRENFPRQYAAVLEKHPDVDLSGDTMARGSHFRALPREKRVRHMGNLFSLVAAFAEEDLGWRQPRIRLRNASGDVGLPQWIAELEVSIDSGDGSGGDGGGRMVVATSPPFTQARHARKVLVHAVAQQYFPAELAVYASLHRGDAVDPNEDPAARRTRLYRPAGPSFVQQLLCLLEAKNPSVAPLSWAVRPVAQAAAADDDKRANGDAAAAAEEEEEGAEGDDGYDTVVLGGADAVADGAVVDPVQLRRPLRPRCVAEVLGQHGDLLVATAGEGVSGARLPPEEALAVPALSAALRHASRQLGGADAETLWTEYEAQPVPPVTHRRELALHLFRAFAGGAGRAAAVAAATADPSLAAGAASVDETDSAAGVELRVEQVGDYWVAVAALPLAAGGAVPLARAISGTKKGSLDDALVLATRRCFSRQLRYIAAHDDGARAVAHDALTEPVVEQLHDGAVRDLQRLLRQRARGGPPPPFALLTRCLRRDQQQRRVVRVEHGTAAGGGQHTCRLYLQPHRRVVERGEAQLVGYGAALTMPQALHLAALVALENLFEEDLRAAEKERADYRALPAP